MHGCLAPAVQLPQIAARSGRPSCTTTLFYGKYKAVCNANAPLPSLQVMMRAAKVQGGADESNGGQSKIDSRGGTLLLSGEDIVSIAVKRFPMQHSAQRPKGLGTDSDIGGRSGIQPGATRQLQQVGWVGGWGGEGGMPLGTSRFCGVVLAPAL